MNFTSVIPKCQKDTQNIKMPSCHTQELYIHREFQGKWNYQITRNVLSRSKGIAEKKGLPRKT